MDSFTSAPSFRILSIPKRLYPISRLERGCVGCVEKNFRIDVSESDSTGLKPTLVAAIIRPYFGSAFSKSASIASSSLFSSDCEGESSAFARLLLSVTTSLGREVA